MIFSDNAKGFVASPQQLQNSSAMWPLIGDLLPHTPHGREVGGND